MSAYSKETTSQNAGNFSHQWAISKPQTESHGGIVAAQHFEAAQVGADILARGGNAMDAAVATAVALSVVEPWLSGLGGGGFLLHATSDGEVDTLDFNMRAPLATDLSDYPLTGGEGGDWFNWPSVEGDRNLIGPMSIGVPGTVAGLAAGLERYGTLSWAEVTAPSVELAERGMRVDWFADLVFAVDTPGLTRTEAARALFLDPMRRKTDAKDPTVRHLAMPYKAAMLRRLADAGPQDFYTGEIAAKLISDMETAGSKLSADDLAKYSPNWASSLNAAYRDRQIHTIPGLSGGPSLLSALSTLEPIDMAQTSEAEFATYHADAIRAAYEIRLQQMGHAAAAQDCTSHVSVVDHSGNMVSLTNTLLSRFGSKIVAPSLELVMNNAMMWFDPRPGQPNSIAPGAAPLANMTPVVTTRNGKPDIAIGAAGGRQIFPALVQLLSRLIDRGDSPEAAFHAPRIDASSPLIIVNRAAPPNTASAVAAHHAVQISEDSLYPVLFAIPSMVQAGHGDAPNLGAVHPNNPWTAACSEGDRKTGNKVGQASGVGGRK
ncbi:gamma-glutamyltransferase [Phaeobacter sp. C3_T13_0]|uniref:gamma-glutamyltransferase n=1 Tax=Phaeobacter cretensis TaxID=3342641 RepID=UPI0039BC5635